MSTPMDHDHTPEAQLIPSPTGRTVFRLDEPIPLCVPASGTTVEVALTASGGRRRLASVPAGDGKAFFAVKPFALSPGEWMITAGEWQAVLQVVSATPRTPFTIGVFAGWFEGEQPQFYNLSGVPSEERVRAFRDDYAINLVMLQNRGFPIEPHTIDLVLQSGAQFTTLNTHATMHQPDEEYNDWSDPETIGSLCYRTQHAAQYLRPYGGFVGVHYADEPGLTWGVETPDGRTFLSGEKAVEPGDYQGPLSIAIQREMYTRATGKPAPDWRHPFEDFDAWMDYMRWRTTILGDVFARFTEVLHAVDPRLLGTSQIYEWAVAGDGCYPPEEAKGVDVLCTHAYCDRQLGFWYCAHETDAMRSGAWDKPLWMLPTWDMGITPPDGVRASVYSTLARKVEGLLWSHDWMMTWPQAKEITARILPISGMLQHAQKLRDDVGIFYSRDQHLYAYAERVMDSAGAGRDYVGKLNTAWMLTMSAHRPASWLVEEELLAGLAANHRVLLAPALTYARPRIKEALERYIADGGTLILDAASTLEIAGAQHLPFAVGDWFNGPANMTDYRAWTDQRRYDAFVTPDLEAFMSALAPHVDPVATCDHPQFMLSLQGGDQARYLWVVNMAQLDRHDEEGRPRCLTPATGTLTLPGGEYAAYDVFTRRRLDDRTITLELDRGDACIYALLPDAITQVRLETPAWQAPELTLNVNVASEQGVIDATIPLQIDLSAPDSTTISTLYRATRHGEFSERLQLGASAMSGVWTVTIIELLSGLSATDSFTVTSTEEPWMTVSPVDLLDGECIARALSPAKGEVLVLYGDASARQAAEALATALQARGVAATADAAAGYLSERPTTRHTCNPPGGAPLAIDKQVVLIGDRQSNPLIARLIDDYQLCPSRVSEAYPGTGRALVYWAHGLFGLEYDIVVIYANDTDGLQQGVAAIPEDIRG